MVGDPEYREKRGPLRAAAFSEVELQPIRTPVRRRPPAIRLRGKGVEARRPLDRLLGVALHGEAATMYELRQQHPCRLPIPGRPSGLERLCVGLARPLFLDELSRRTSSSLNWPHK